jgi:preprotein translocase subunit SecG
VVLVLRAARQGRRHGRRLRQRLGGQPVRLRGRVELPVRATGILAAVFFATSLGLTYFSTVPAKSGGVTSGIEAAKPAPGEGDATDAKPAAPSPRPAPEPAAPAKAPEIPK